MNYEKKILNLLLDKYENSKQFVFTETDVAMDEEDKKGGSIENSVVKLHKYRIILRMQLECPFYDEENSDGREACNAAVLQLAKQNLIGYEWVKHECDNLLNRVWIYPKEAPFAYSIVGRYPKEKLLKSILQRVRRMQVEMELSDENVVATNSNQDWGITQYTYQYLKDEEQHICEKKALSKYLPRNDEKVAMDILCALAEIQKLSKDGCLQRIFSMRCFGDSKYFEKSIKGKIVKILRNYLPYVGASEEITEDEVLEQAGIYRIPEQIDFCGSLQAELEGNMLDFSKMVYGASMNADTIKCIDITSIKEVEAIFFIENKANYVSFARENQGKPVLSIFHGGFYSPIKKMFFQKLSRVSCGIPCFHWGDVDLGGFHMHRRLKTEIFSTLLPYQMDCTAFSIGKKFWLPIEKVYGEKLEQLLKSQEYSMFWPVISEMLKNKAKMEQEALLCV